MRPLLAIETSGQSLGVAVYTDSGLVFEENVTAGMIHGRALVPLMQKALHTLPAPEAQGTELEALAVSLGPGSWTGLRIGLSAAKAFAWAAGVRIVGVPSFEALAREALSHAPGQAILTLRDARSEGCFLALFAETHGRLERWIGESVLPAADVVGVVGQVLAGQGGAPLAVCGDRKCLEVVAQPAQARGWRLLTELEHIPARAVARCGWERLERGAGVVSGAAEIHRLAPLYLRASDPELKLKLRPQMNADKPGSAG